MDFYEELAKSEMNIWYRNQKKKPSFINRLSKGTQKRINNLIPERIHKIITYAIEKMVKGVLFGTTYITPSILNEKSLWVKEQLVDKKIKFYRNTASAEGAITGAGGILMGFADFPAFLAIKIKLLFEIAATYGYDIKNYRERLFILYIFKLAFASQKSRNETIQIIASWDRYIEQLPQEIESFDWRNFQLEYRDYLDLVKLAQLIPIIGAGVGAIANYQLVKLLGKTAKNCYRMRIFKEMELLK